MRLEKFEDNKGVIRSSKLNDRQYNDQKKKDEDTKRGIRSSELNDRQCNAQKKKDEQ